MAVTTVMISKTQPVIETEVIELNSETITARVYEFSWLKQQCYLQLSVTVVKTAKIYITYPPRFKDPLGYDTLLSK
jgi:hypothetical protein